MSSRSAAAVLACLVTASAISAGTTGVVPKKLILIEKNQMPPLASDLVDPTGLATIAAWIATLPPP